MTWRDASACRDTDPAVFYPTPDPHANARKNRTDPYALARILCDGCPVQADCLQEALDTGDTYGFRGGRTPQDIHVMLYGDLSTIAKECDWCGVRFTLGKYHNMKTRYCSRTCGRAAERAATREKRRDRGGRAVA